MWVINLFMHCDNVIILYGFALFENFMCFSENLDIVAKSDVTLEKREGFHFYNVTAIHVKFSIGGLKLHMYNLFDGIKALGKFDTSCWKD